MSPLRRKRKELQLNEIFIRFVIIAVLPVQQNILNVYQAYYSR